MASNKSRKPAALDDLKLELLDEAAFTQERNAAVYRMLFPQGVGIGFFYIVFLALYGTGRLPEMPLGVVIAAGISSVYFLGVAEACRRQAIPVSWAHVVGALNGYIAVTNNLTRLYLSGDFLQTLVLIVLIVAGGMLVVSWRWLIGYLAYPVTGWIVVMALRGTEGVPVGSGALGVAAGVALSAIAHAGRIRQLRVAVALQQHRDARQRELEEAMEASSQSEARFRTLSEATAEGVLLIENSVVLDANQAAGDMFGLPIADVIGGSISNLLPTEAWQRVSEQIDQRSSDPLETVGRRHDGAMFPLEVVTRQLPYRGRIAHVVALRDLSARKRAEQDIRMLAHALRSIGDAVFIADLEQHFTFVNEAFLSTFGYEEGNVLGRRAEILWGDPSQPNPLDLIARDSTGARWRGEILGRRNDDSALPVALSVSLVFDANDQPVAMVGIAKDITKEKAHETELILAKEKAEEMTQLKSAFLANMSHEIRTPMNGVIGMTSLLLDTRLDSQQQEHVEVIRTSSESLLSIINDILDFSKIEAGQMVLEEHPFELRTCVEDALDLFALKASEKNLELIECVSPDVPLQVEGDSTRLRQVIVNLLSNALKFTDQGEIVVTVEARPADQDRLALHFAVRDTGVGIPADRRDRLFQSFSQVDASITRRYGGTGLGLTISRRLCRLMGGELEVDSVEGQGSTFHFTVLCRPVGAPAGPAPAFPENKRVLVFDRCETRRVFVGRLLQAWKMHPLVVPTASEANALLEEEDAIALAMLDCDLGEAEGAGFVRRIRDRYPSLPVMVLGSMDRSLSTPNDENVILLKKPVKESTLRRNLAQLLGDGSPEDKAPRSANPSFDTSFASQFPLSVLLADDNVVNQRVASLMLKRLGYRPDVAANGIEVVQAVESRHYDLLFLDVQMPEMDGLEASSHIVKHFARDARPYIVAMTAEAMAGYDQVCYAAGMDDYVSKPVRLENLVAAIRRCVGSRTSVATSS